MPVNISLKDSKLRITYHAGVDVHGRDIKKSKTYTSIKPSAVDEDIFAVATTLIDLQKQSALQVERLDQKEITQA